MFGFINRLLTWWNSSTPGTSWFTFRKGKKVGEDDQGNRYFTEKGGDKRWVIYNGEVEASRVPPEWHAWLHHLVDDLPSERPLPAKSWEKPHVPNLTGTPGAYVPPGSLSAGGERSRATGDYEAWNPDEA